MILVTGGMGQGKLEYVRERTGAPPEAVACTVQEAAGAAVFDGVSRWIRAALQAGDDPDALLDALLEKNPGIVLIFDEVGCGVVPLDPEERLWRERAGRTACRLAKRADAVVRVLCGIPMMLKGEERLPWN